MIILGQPLPNLPKSGHAGKLRGELNLSGRFQPSREGRDVYRHF